MSIHKLGDQQWKVRWREAGHHRSLTVYGPRELAKKIERKRMSARDENRHLDIKKEVHFRMSELIDRYEQQYGKKKKSYSRERSILTRISILALARSQDTPPLRRIPRLFALNPAHHLRR